MKPIYRCEYCDFTDIEEEVQKHEAGCPKNYNRKNCWTCKHCWTDGIKTIGCNKGKEIPEGKMYTYCETHEIGEPEVKGFMGAFMDAFK